ncbi:hypothetical protein CEXT_97591 [Caerostris extrusa]|uniref:Uncharacterized protein n=1 Tax=Caerostris extrusa TaxID=172846 RepID=A0AAV4XDT0_CAEEX|nr:hypothetical protein CEXT_97591 [Caerostris extrusa]
MSFKEVITSPLSNNLRLIFRDCRTANPFLRDPSLTLFGKEVRSSQNRVFIERQKRNMIIAGMRDTMHSSGLSQFHCAMSKNSLPHFRREK